MKKIILSLLFLFFSSVFFGQNASDIDPTFNQFNLPLEKYYLNKASFTRKFPDGKLLVLTYNKKLIRIDGHFRDTSFNAGETSSQISDIAIQADGKVIIVGTFTNFNGSGVSKIVRLNYDGSIDTTFNISLQGFYSPTEVIIQSTGKIIIKFNNFSSFQYNGITVGNKIRLFENGNFDYSYNYTQINFEKIKLLKNDEFLSWSGDTSSEVSISKLDQNGFLNLNFTNVILKFSGGANVHIGDIISDENNIYLIGSFDLVNNVSKKNIVKFDYLGLINSTFNLNATNSPSNPEIHHINFFFNNRILILGSFNNVNGTTKENIVCVDESGAIDNTFLGLKSTSYVGVSSFIRGQNFYIINTESYNDFPVKFLFSIDQNGNILTHNKTKGIDNIVNIGLQNDGKILVSTYLNEKYNGTKIKGSLLRLLPNGEIDNTFNFGGGSGIGVSMTNAKIETDSNNKIYFPYYRSSESVSVIKHNNLNYNNIIRMKSDGTIDPAFTTGTGFRNNSNNLTSISKTKLQSDNKLLVMPKSTATSYNGQSVNKLARLNYNGTLDMTFKNNFQLTDPLYDFVLLSNSKILICTTITGIYRIFRYNSDGTYDSTFNYIQNLGSNPPLMISEGFDGSIYVTKDTSSDDVLMKYTSEGIPVTSFQEILDCVDILFQSNNKMILSFSSSSGNTIKRYDTNGQIDNTFDLSSTSTSEYIFSNVGLQILEQEDGKILLAGHFNSYKNNKTYPIIRIYGNDFNLYKGNVKLDQNINGCDTTDPNFYGLKFTVNNQNVISNYYTNSIGAFKYHLENGINEITPVLNNPNYFTITPETLTLNIPTVNNPQIQDYCVTPVGNHSDLEIAIVPINNAVSGFTTRYRIVYKNKGNQALSGNFSLNYNDNKMNFFSESYLASNSSFGTRTWNYTNLQPFESREILVIFNLNSPTDNPSLNAGDVLTFTAATAQSFVDETPNDNTFTLNQPVVNSYDPNDKICLDGSVVGLDKVGEYVYYRIRFENTGNYKATNINVLDVLDTNKFDINTLIPVNGSHLFTTKITEGNKVEFYFENINLDFQDATNDGYLVYKIKTKSNLVAGDTFGGNANIYFDYNYPITTNIYTTVIQALSAQDFEIENYFDLYPIPVDSTLNISKKSSIKITSIEIYNIYGQVIQAIPNARDLTSIDVLNLAVGTYFIKINSELGSANAKFIKK